MPVTSYITKDEYKQLAWLSSLTPVQEAQLDLILPAVKSSIDNVLWDLVRMERTIKVNFGNVTITRGIWKIYTYNINITDVQSINWVAIQEFKTDWRLNNIILCKIWENTELNDYPEIDIVLTNWFKVELEDENDPIPVDLPSDIKYLSFLMAKDWITQLWWWNIIKKKIGDKELWFSSNTSDNIQSMISNTISLYKLYHI